MRLQPATADWSATLAGRKMQQCHQAFAVTLIVCSTTVVLPMARYVLAEPAAQDLVTYDDELFAAIARAREIPDLREMSLPAGYREIRIRDDLSMISYMPTPMLRLSEDPDGTRRGELLLFRRLLLRPGNPAPRADERCAPLRDQHVCVRMWHSQSDDWVAIASALEQLDAWSISERCEVSRDVDGGTVLLGFATDSGGLHIQRLMGAAFTRYRCNAPPGGTTPAGQRADAIYQYFLGVVGKIPYELDTVAR
jgi:hypothetical protein